jgi:hypothetical protein
VGHVVQTLDTDPPSHPIGLVTLIDGTISGRRGAGIGDGGSDARTVGSRVAA